MMAMRELKLPMLKHSLATSIKNSITRALCFFLPGCTHTHTHRKILMYWYIITTTSDVGR